MTTLSAHQQEERSETPHPPGHATPRRGSRLRLAAVCAVLFLTFLDNTIISVTLGDLQTSLRPGVLGLQWVVDGFMLAFAVLMLTGGTLGDIFGRRLIMLVGIGLFTAGSVIAMLASSTEVVIAGRVIMGIGAAGSEPGTLSMIRHLFPDRAARARALGAWAAVSGAALAFGPIIGGVIVGVSGWREVFAFNIAFGAATFVAVMALLPENSDPEDRHLDLPGLVLGAAAVGVATIAVIHGESAGYTTWWIDALFAAAVVLLAGFLLFERRARDPVLRLEFFTDRTFRGANIVAFATNFAIFAVFFFTVLYLQLLGGFSGYAIAVQFLAMAAAMVAAAWLAGWWVARSGPRWPTALGGSLAGLGLLAVDWLLSPHVSPFQLAWALGLAGAGFGMTLVTMTSSVLTLVPARRSGMAASTVNTFRELGGVFGVAVLGAIVNGQLTGRLAEELQKIGIPAQFQSLVINAVTHGGVPSGGAGPAAKAHPHLVHEVISAAESAFGSGLNIALLIAAGLMFAAAVVAVGFPSGPLRPQEGPGAT